jgi:hypothetical protein
LQSLAAVERLAMFPLLVDQVLTVLLQLSRRVSFLNISMDASQERLKKGPVAGDGNHEKRIAH